jgi:uncharacterized lipoprotein YmbA
VTRNRFKKTLSIALIATLLGAGCVSFGKTEPARFYLLSSLTPDAGQAAAKPREGVVGVWPVTIADYLRRPQVVTRPTDHQVSVDEFDRWAEPLDEVFARVLVDNLSVLTDFRVLNFPWTASTSIDTNVEVVVERFEQIASGNVLLSVRWTLLEPDEKTVRVSRTTIIEKAEVGPTTEDVVAAMSGAVADLSREIATALAGTR